MDTIDNYTMMNNYSETAADVITPSPLEIFARAFLRPSGIISVIAASFGIIFNILNIIVLSHPKMRNSVNLLLTMLAASQLCLLIIYIPYVVIFNLTFDTAIIKFHTASMHQARFMLFYTNTSVFAHSSASWLIITTACFRFIYVQFPLRSSQLCSYKRAIIAGSTTILACLLINIPNIMLNTIINYPCEQYPNPVMCANTTYYTIGIRHTFGQTFQVFNFWLYAVFVKFIPGILLLIFTIFLIRVLREANQRKKRLHSDAGINRHVQQASTQTSDHTQTARMLLAVVVLFFLIEFPHGLLLIYVVVKNAFLMYGHLGEVIDLATVIAFSLNLILYSAMSRQYRKLFIDIFIRRIINKLRFTKFRAKYKKCSCGGTSHNAVCMPAKTETCALSIAHDVHTVHSIVPSDESLNLIDGKPKQFLNK